MSGRAGMSWERLNAYVDDELAPTAAADVAAAVASDPDVAARVASLARLRATVRTLPRVSDAPAFCLPVRRRFVSHRAIGLAASLLLVALVGGMLWLRMPSTQDEAASLSAAIAAHRHWLASAGPEASARIKVDLASADAGALPDLTAASLRLVHLSLDPAGRQGGGLLAGYLGPHGCRLGLWIGPHRGRSGGGPAIVDGEGLRIRAWSAGAADYALLSRGMDPQRLDHVAGIVANLTRQGHGATEQQTAALREVQSIGEACTA